MHSLVGRYDFVINQGCSGKFTVVFQDCEPKRVNFAGFLLRCQIKKGVYGKVIDELSSGEGRITISSSENDHTLDQVTFHFPSSVTEKYPIGTLLYDLEGTSQCGDTTRLMEGQIKCIDNVTK